METSELAWAAGLFEGEGCIRINKSTKRNLGALIVAVTNTDEQVIDFLHSRWGGCKKPASGLRADQRRAWVWVTASRRAALFLKAIEPFVVRDIVRERIRVGLQFQAGKSTTSRVSDEYREDQFNAYQWMCHLNTRGRGAEGIEWRRR